MCNNTIFFHCKPYKSQNNFYLDLFCVSYIDEFYTSKSRNREGIFAQGWHTKTSKKDVALRSLENNAKMILEIKAINVFKFQCSWNKMLFIIVI